MVKCDKCSGTGLYRQFGICFACKGSGKVKANRGLSVEMQPRVVALTCLDTGEHNFKPYGQYQRCECGIIR